MANDANIAQELPSSMTPMHIQELASAFQRSRALLTAYELGLFTALADERRTSTEIAAALQTDARATDRLMNVMVTLGLLEKQDNRFANTPAARQHLVRGRPGYMAGLAHTVNLWDTWSTLTSAVRAGHAVGRSSVNERDADWVRTFIGAMHARATPNAAEVVGLLDLSRVARVLDVGGGSGAYAMAFARANAGLEAVVFDLPNVVPLTQEYVAQGGLSGRVRTVGGDYLRDDLGRGFDLVFLSAIIHSNSPDEIRALLGKCVRALNPGGQLIIQDFIVDEDRTGPPFAVLFALNMLVGTDTGDTFTESEVRAWMQAAGVSQINRKNTTFGTTLLAGSTPA